MNARGMAASAQGQDPDHEGNFPFQYPPSGDQGAYPGSWVGGHWNQAHQQGAGMYGWKLDVDKMIPYYPLAYSGAHALQKAVCTPLRVSKHASFASGRPSKPANRNPALTRRLTEDARIGLLGGGGA